MGPGRVKTEIEMRWTEFRSDDGMQAELNRRCCLQFEIRRSYDFSAKAS